MGDVEDVHAAAPGPDELTVTVTLEAPSDTTTLPPGKAAEGLILRMVRSEPLTVALTLGLLEAALSGPAALDMVTKEADEQSLRVTELGLAARLPLPPQAPAPAPEALTVMVRLDAPSEMSTVPPPNPADGVTLRMVTSEPLTLALTLGLLDAADTGPLALETVTNAAVEQSVRVTVVGDAAKLPLPPHAPAPAPVALTVIGTFDCPSETVTMPPVNEPEGDVRLMVSKLPFTVAVTAPLSGAAL